MIKNIKRMFVFHGRRSFFKQSLLFFHGRHKKRNKKHSSGAFQIEVQNLVVFDTMKNTSVRDKMVLQETP